MSGKSGKAGSGADPAANQRAVAMYRVRPQLEQLAQERFAFLVAEREFVAGRITHDVFATTYRYLSSQIGIEVTLDFRDQALDMNLVKLHNGRMPRSTGRVDLKTGECLRQPLDLYLRDHMKIQDEWLDALFALYRMPMAWGYEQTAEVLQAARDVVYHHLDLLLQQPMDALFPSRPVRSARLSPPTQ